MRMLAILYMREHHWLKRMELSGFSALFGCRCLTGKRIAQSRPFLKSAKNLLQGYVVWLFSNNWSIGVTVCLSLGFQASRLKVCCDQCFCSTLALVLLRVCASSWISLDMLREQLIPGLSFHFINVNLCARKTSLKMNSFFVTQTQLAISSYWPIVGGNCAPILRA